MADPEDEREVLTSLPRSRPTRRSPKRGDRTEPGGAAAPPKDREPPAETAERPQTGPRRKVPPAGYAAPEGGDQAASAGATEMLTTAFQAVTELAQIGVSVGRQVLQSAFDRLPKP